MKVFSYVVFTLATCFLGLSVAGQYAETYSMTDLDAIILHVLLLLFGWFVGHGAFSILEDEM